ncbi:MAG: hypothetical protein ACYCXW_18365 [Solirubrobacteraceae bacterium]
MMLLPLGGSVAAASASAEKVTYGCPNECPSVSGPNISPIDFTSDFNNSGEGVCALLWEYHGGSNYSLIERKCESKQKVAFVAKYCIKVSGHGEAEPSYKQFDYRLSGEENWICE